MQDPLVTLPQDSGIGQPCAEGGAVRIKDEDYFGFIDPKDIMLFYTSSREAAHRLAILQSPAGRARLSELTRAMVFCIRPQRVRELPAPLRSFANCIADSRRSLGVVVAAEAANRVDMPAAEEDSYLSGSSMASGWVLVHRLKITISRNGNPVGEMALIVVIQPYIQLQR